MVQRVAPSSLTGTSIKPIGRHASGPWQLSVHVIMLWTFIPAVGGLRNAHIQHGALLNCSLSNHTCRVGSVVGAESSDLVSALLTRSSKLISSKDLVDIQCPP